MMPSKLARHLLLGTLFFFVIGAALPIWAATWTVTSTADGGTGSLRAALGSAANGDIINFSLTYPATITLTSGYLEISTGVSISGPGAENLFISGNNLFSVFSVGGVTATISGMTIENGIGYNTAGGLYNGGTLTVSNCTFSGNSTEITPIGGGAISNGGTLTVSGSTFSGNIADGAFGGAIVNYGTATLTNSTFSGNTATGTGGAILNNGTLTVSFSTFSGNTADSGLGGGIQNNGTLTVKSTLLAGQKKGGNCSGSGTSDGYNLSDDSSCTFLTATGDQNDVTDAATYLGPLQYNGGPTQTIALLSGSPGSTAIDAVPFSACTDANSNPVVTDQRGTYRPQGTAGNCDIGAYELAQVPTAYVCPNGQTTPTPCSASITLQYYVPSGTTLSSTRPVQVVTQGASGLDFSQVVVNSCSVSGNGRPKVNCDAVRRAGARASTGALAHSSGASPEISAIIPSCSNGLEGPSYCEVAVTFAPIAPGLRLGASTLFDNSGNVVASYLLSGIGNAPAVAFTPSPQATLSVTLSAPPTGLSNPSGVAVDAAGDVFIADTDNNRVVEVPGGTGTPVVVPATSLSSPSGVAVDGAGDVFIADTQNKRVVEVPAGGGSQIVVASGFLTPVAVAVDGAGDVFVVDLGANQVVEIPFNNGPQTVVSTGSYTLTSPQGIAVDAAGDMFIADSGNTRVLEVPAGGSASVVPTSGLAFPTSVAVDAAGDVFIGDASSNHRVVEVPAGGGSQFTVSDSGFTLPAAVAVDGEGNVYIVDYEGGQIVEVSRSQPPSLSFDNTVVSQTSSDSPQSVIAQNIGNLALTADSPGLVVTGPNFVQVAGSGTPADCTNTFSLTEGATCNLSVSFEPQSSTPVPLTSTAVFTDNALNAGVATYPLAKKNNLSPAPATQTINLTGTGIQGTVGVTVSTNVTGPTISVDGGTPFTGSQTFTWNIGSPHTFATTSPQYPTTGTEYTFSSWPDGTSNPSSDSVTAAAGTTSYTATFNTLYQLTTAANPSNGGTVTPSSGTYYPATTVVNLTAFPLPDYQFTVWAGLVENPSTASTTVTMTAPQTVTADFTPAGSGVFFSNVQFTVPATGLSDPNGVAVDGAGDVFIVDHNNNNVIEVPANGGPQITLVSGLNLPWAVAADEAGDVYVTDTFNNNVLKIPAGGGTATPVGSGWSVPNALALDGAGDLFVVDNGGTRVSELTPGGVQTTLPFSGLDFSAGIAVDRAGDVFVTDNNNETMYELPYLGGGNYGAQQQILTGYSGGPGPWGVSVDASGDLFVGEWVADQVVEFPASAPGGQVTLPVVGLGSPHATAIDSFGDLFIEDRGNKQVVEYQTVAPNFGDVNVCPGSQTTPAPCRKTLTLNFSVLNTTNFGTPKVTTQGASGLDFSLATGGTCTGIIVAPNTCTVNVTFKPTEPGERVGAIQLFDATNNLLTTTLLHGIGLAPLVAFTPSPQTALSITVPTGPSTLNSPDGLAVDASGDIFIADSQNNRIVEVPGGTGTPVVVPATGLSSPGSVAVDGAGDVFIADTQNHQVVEVPAGGGSQKTVASGFSLPVAVAVDGAGDLFVLDLSANKVVEIPFNNGPQITVNTGGYTLSSPQGMALDAAGDVFIADSGNNRVLEILAGGGSATVISTSGLAFPASVAVDAAGDVFIGDAAANHRVVEVPAGGGSQFTITSTGFTLPAAVTVDGAGNVYIADYLGSQVLEVSRSHAPSLTFDPTNIGNTSTDSPRLVTVQNVGTQNLAGSLSLTNLGTDFTQSASPDCSTAFPLAAGATCSESFSFSPQTSGSLTGSAAFTDNTLNLSPQVTQTVSLKGTLASVTVTVSTNITGPTISVDGGTPFTGSKQFTWTIGTPHTFSTTSPQSPSAGTEYALASWPDGTSSTSDSVTAAANTLSYTADFNTLYRLTTAANPTADGYVTPTSGQYYVSGTLVHLTANANTGYKFSSWTGNVASTSSNPTTITLNSPQTVTANFVVNNVSVIITTSPAGLLVSVDGAKAKAAPISETWQAGTSHTIATSSPQGSSGTQYIFTKWSDGGALSHKITVPASATTYTATFTTNYLLTTAASPSSDGSVTPPSGTYYAAGTKVNLTATAKANYLFSKWVGNVASTSSASTTVTMNAPESVTADFVTAPVTVSPTSVSLGNVPEGQKAKQDVTLDNTTTKTIAIDSVTLSVTTGNPSQFSLVRYCGTTLGAGKTCTIAVLFAPDAIGKDTATLTIVTNAAGSPIVIPITAAGVK